MSKQPPPAPTASAIGPCRTLIQIVGRPGTESLPCTFAPPDHPRQHFVTTRVVHLPKRTEASIKITKSDKCRPNHQLLQLCTACTAWSDLDQAVRAVHSCSSWLYPLNALSQAKLTGSD